MPDRFVTVGTFATAAEAHVAKTRLESDGIDCLLADESLLSLHWLYATAKGGLRLQVPEKDFQDAIKSLNRVSSNETVQWQTKVLDKPECPQCRTTNVYFDRHAGPLSYLAQVFPRLVKFLSRGRWVCRECGSQWKGRWV